MKTYFAVLATIATLALVFTALASIDSLRIARDSNNQLRGIANAVEAICPNGSGSIWGTGACGK
jgi:hypothetical protein